ncbi:50S ribosomal protein L11 methyltransferase [Candidatus Sumerlaeota bacterium]|nr:50S ribosomal protein L11 methyltransferase [Candidatus Sumerlaeota bacterium]
MYHELHFIWSHEASELTLELLADWLQENQSLGWEDRGAASGERRTEMLGATHWAVYFDEKQSASELMKDAQIFSAALPHPPDQVNYQAIEEQDWTEPFKAYFHAKRVAPCWWVAPPWEQERAELRTGEHLLIIEPGMAFGTGLHESTQLCLKMLPDCVAPAARVIDIGAGSGILSIAAVKLGAHQAVAIEIDPQAEENLRLNLSLNAVTKNVCVYIGGADQAGAVTAPLVVCNMLMSRFRPIANAASAMVEQNGALLLSGCVENERDQTTRLLEELGFIVENTGQINEWIGFYARKA